jgi:hypothetical protein
VPFGPLIQLSKLFYIAVRLKPVILKLTLNYLKDINLRSSFPPSYLYFTSSWSKDHVLIGTASFLAIARSRGPGRPTREKAVPQRAQYLMYEVEGSCATHSKHLGWFDTELSKIFKPNGTLVGFINGAGDNYSGWIISWKCVLH